MGEEIAFEHININGLSISYFSIGEGPLILCSYGFPDSAESFLEVMPTIASQGYRVVSFYQRGYFPSEIPKDRDFSILSLVNDQLALIDPLQEKRLFF